MSCETDEECKRYINNINATITDIWTNTESDIAKIELDNTENVNQVVERLLAKKQRIDSIRQGLSSRNRDLKNIQERLESVTDESEQHEQNQKSLEEIEKNNEKVLHYAQLLQSADGRQHEIPKNYQITLSNFLPVTLPFAKKIVLMTIPKENTISYLIGLIIALLATLCFLAYTVYKMARPLFLSETIKVDSNVADQLAEIDQSEKDTPDDKQEDKSPEPTTDERDETKTETPEPTEPTTENKLIPS